MKQQIVIIGAGFAGIQLARNLDGYDCDVLLIDKVNHHQFQPLFYQVATAQIEPSSISFPVRNIFRNKTHIRIRLAEVRAVDRDAQQVETSVGNFRYDILVLAMGCKTNFFGNTELGKHVFTLKSTAGAIRIRNHVLKTFEDILSASPAQCEPLMNMVIVGGGPTGVELAGAFAEIRRNILPRDYPGIDFTGFRITLVEGSAHTLNNMSPLAKRKSEAYLTALGVHILKQTIVTGYDGEVLQLNNGQQMAAHTVIWTAGVTPNTIQGIPPESMTKGNRITVDRFNKVSGCENIYALGDICSMITPLYPKGHPQVANVAINQAKNLARNLRRMRAGKSLLQYEYRDRGTMATIGRHKAVVDMGKIHFSGYAAWFAWMFLHLMLILSVRNKLIIFINWAWDYIMYDSSLRLILNPNNDEEGARQ